MNKIVGREESMSIQEITSFLGIECFQWFTHSDEFSQATGKS